MNNEQILKKAIDKAVGNGWEINQAVFDYIMDFDRNSVTDYFMEEKKYYPIIYCHKFAKAFWGERKIERRYTNSQGACCGENRNDYKESVLNYGWRHHLKVMVILEKPLKYLEKFLK